MTIYKKTATKNIKSKRNAVYAFGRETSLDGQSPDLGGYILYVLRDRFVGRNGDLLRKWEYVQGGLGHKEAMALMNKKVHHKAFSE